MKRDTVQACLACHDKPIAKTVGAVVAAVGEVAQPGLVKHGPIRDGNCSGCHNLHGSQFSRLLSQPYPETFYQPFKAEAYALCFTCHDKNLVLTEKTEGLTRFRNGDLNLHYLHVNKPDRGRSCYACHSTHASAQPAHVRDTVPYGNWEIPINFKQTGTGGSCAPGCHRASAYDRASPVVPPPAPPAAAGPAPAPPAAAAPAVNPPSAAADPANESKTEPPPAPPPAQEAAKPPALAGAGPVPAPPPAPASPKKKEKKL
jgi:predicted CXXCH cytochrome family protein